ncbi:pseudouridine synthase [Rhizobium sp. KVB221]|uniref:Pseudouridine synthase n=1 Tax=Rhizobium setariae TaxID=2801340 RepID=A0A937CJ08_9HYPH|nr:pseudouridine synthase [Rhizobium setariae]MBL0370610.1 pseudouridine synthase [Rhizobium setariae]
MKNTRKPGEGGRKPFKGDGKRAERGDRAGGKPPVKKSFASKPRSQPEKNPDHVAVTGEGERISKIMARAGVASRRDCERMIMEGRVNLNGKVLDSPAVNCTPSDIILVDGEPIGAIERTRLWIYCKPAGLVTTNHDPEGRPTVFDNLPPELPRVISVGRLDINTEGLLLLTNDGGLARMLELPTTGWLRRYRVRAYGSIDQARLDELKDGIAVDGVFYGAIEATLDREQGHNVWITIGLREGKNREVKNVLGSLGLDVNRLIRISYGPFQLGELEDGEVVEVKSRTLRDQLGPRLIEEANANFEAPIFNTGKPDEEAKADSWERPQRQERHESRERDSGRSDAKRPERSERPARGDRPERSERPARGDRPERSERPDWGDRPPRDRDRDGDRRGGPHGRDRDDNKKKRPPLGTTRTANVWMAPGARPVATKKPKDEAAGDANPNRRTLRLKKDDGDAVASPRQREDMPKRTAGAQRPDRPERRERSERPERGERPAARPFARKRDDAAGEGGHGRPERSFEGKRSEGKPRGDKPFGDKPRGDKPFGAKREGDRREGPAKGPRSFGGKPKTEGDRSTRPRGEGPRGDGPRGDGPRGDGPHKGGPGGKGPGSRGVRSGADRRR